MQPAVLDQPMRLVEQRRHLLDLVDHDLRARPRRLGLELLAEQLGPGQIATELVRLQQIDPAVLAVGLPEQGALPRLTGSPEKEGLGPGAGQDELSLEHLFQNITIL
jgi:hypothetical protein